jgi:hypothetical protein
MELQVWQTKGNRSELLGSKDRAELVLEKTSLDYEQIFVILSVSEKTM